MTRITYYTHSKTVILYTYKLYTTQLMFSSPWFRTAHRHLMTSNLAPMINFCLTKLHILMTINLSFACSTETVI